MVLIKFLCKNFQHGAENDALEEQDCYLIIHIFQNNSLTLNTLKANLIYLILKQFLVFLSISILHRIKLKRKLDILIALSPQELKTETFSNRHVFP